MTRDIQVALFKDKNRPAAKSMPQSELLMYQDIGKASDLAQPGGFRRGHVIAASEEEQEEPPLHALKPFMKMVRPPSRFNSATEFYDDFVCANFNIGTSTDEPQDPQSTPLIKIPPFVARERGSSTKKTVFTILKSFIGSGILFLPKGFENGGMLFSIVILIFAGALSTFCMLRLTSCLKTLPPSKNGNSVSYGMLGERAFGKIGKRAVNVSLVLSQIGFCCTYLIFIEKNIRDVIMHVTACKIMPGPWLMIALQIPIYTPLTWVRKIKYFAMTNLLADVLVLFGLLYILSYSAEHMAEAKEPAEWHNFNAQNYGLFLGTAVYVFEGIGLVLPIYNSMDASIRHTFPKVLKTTIGFLVSFFCVFAGVVYAAFGTETQAVVTLNLPSNGINGGTIAVQVAYCVALIFTYPLMMYPALMILEGYFIPNRRGTAKGALRIRKNLFRCALVCVTAVISMLAMDELDNFVAFIGSFCSTPLAFIYPCLFHSRLVNSGHVLNICIVVLGSCAMIFTTYQSASTWAPSAQAIDYCQPV